MMRRQEFRSLLLATSLVWAACSPPDESPPDTDVCDPIVCAAEIAGPTCVGNTLVVTIGSLGCSLFGLCDYEETREDCEYGCDDGACLVPCGGLTCSDPSEPACEGNQVIAEQTGGELNRNTCRCRYDEVVTDCEDDVCVDGACVAFACDILDCTSPPVDVCDGDFALHYPEEGGCDADARECTYDPEVEDCPGAGMACENGRCVDNCGGVVCDEAPDDRCTGTTATQWSAEGTCLLDGECEYAFEQIDCALEGAECIDAVCVPLCIDEDCTSPPASECLGDTALHFTSPGTCSEIYECEYDLTEEDCVVTGLVCVDGACSEEPTCIGIACDEPPAAFCEETIAHSFLVPGECVAGPECVYEERIADCDDDPGLVCASGVCTPFCEAVTCDAPPENVCDGDTLTQFEVAGVCNEETQACDYVETAIDCTATDARCFDGECLTGCIAGLCLTPPETITCAGAQVIGFSSTASCTEAETCAYALEVVEDCAPFRICHAGECVAVCGDGFCVSPPLDRCEGDEFVSHGPIGDCVGGACSYAETRENCRDTGLACISDPREGGAACRDACDGYLDCGILPPSYCVDDTLVVVSFPSDCSDSLCQFTETDFDCTESGDICSAGACVHPCMGVVCDDPPADVCAASMIVYFEDIGTCDAGECSYSATNFDCESLDLDCVAAECIDACLEVVCDTTPPDGCEGDELVDYVEADGACAVGICFYEEVSRLDCTETGRSCVDGACVNLCAGVSCTSRPPRECVDDIARAYGSFGTCAFGVCSYPTSDEDCQDSGRVCIDGRCGGSCVPSECDRSVLAECDGFVRVTYPGTPPLCIEGQCVRDSDEYDCLTDGTACSSGECIPSADICADLGCAGGLFCDGDQVVTRSGPGICVPGPPTTCDYTGVETTDSCAPPLGCYDAACVRIPRPGELVITEIFFDVAGTDTDGEWVEIYNRTAEELQLAGIELTSNGGRITIESSTIIPPTGFVLLAADGASVGGADYRYEYFHFPLANSSDTISISRNGVDLDSVAYDVSALWSGGPGNSLSLDPLSHTDVANDGPFQWCGGGAGTPGALNPGCL